MRARHRLLTAVAILIALAIAADARAQHEGHQTPAAPAPASRTPDCAPAARRALSIVDAANARLETAARTPVAADLQDTVAEAQRAVAAAQAELFTCRAAVPSVPVGPAPAPMPGMDHSQMNMVAAASGAKQGTPGAKPGDSMAGMDHSKMPMATAAPAGKPAARAATPADPMAGTDHSKMPMGKAAPSGKPATRAAKPADPMAGMDHSKMPMGAAAGKPAVARATPAAPAPAPPMAGMDHSKMAMGGDTPKSGDAATPVTGESKLPVAMAERVADPACPGNVGQATAPRSVYERKVYYFCSAAARDEFRKNPAAYLKKHPR